MASISNLGSQIHLNQNMSAVSNKFANQYARIHSNDIQNENSFEENQKRLKDTRETEESGEIDENLNDREVYSVVFKKKKREREEGEKSKENYQLDAKKGKIDIKV